MPVTVTWQQLRETAEHAHGLQDLRLGIYHDGSTLVCEAYDPAQADKYLMETAAVAKPVKTGQLKVCLPGINAGELQKRLKKPLSPDLDVFEHADAVLWSLPAVEKFLVPYYASYMDLAYVITEIRDKFEKRSDVLAYIHLPNSEVVDDGSKAVGRRRAPTLFAVVPDTTAGKDKVKLLPVL